MVVQHRVVNYETIHAKQQKGTQQDISILIKDKDETNLRMNERDPGMDNWEESV